MRCNTLSKDETCSRGPTGLIIRVGAQNKGPKITDPTGRPIRDVKIVDLEYNAHNFRFFLLLFFKEEDLSFYPFAAVGPLPFEQETWSLFLREQLEEEAMTLVIVLWLLEVLLLLGLKYGLNSILKTRSHGLFHWNEHC